MKEKSPGGKHPDITYPYNISGLDFFEEGDDSSALQYSERASEILRATFGEVHPTYTKSDRFQYLATQDSTDPLLLNLADLQGDAP